MADAARSWKSGRLVRREHTHNRLRRVHILVHPLAVPLATEDLLTWDEGVDLIEHQAAHSRAERLGELASGFPRKQLAVLGRRSHHHARRRQLSGRRRVALCDKAHRAAITRRLKQRARFMAELHSELTRG